MTNKQELEKRLKIAKQELEDKGYFLGEEGELMDLIPSMKQYEYRFQDAIEQVWPDDPWWKHTHYWDIFQNSIMSGKSADEVIQDILDHIVDEDEGIKEEFEDGLKENYSLEEILEAEKMWDRIMELEGNENLSEKEEEELNDLWENIIYELPFNERNDDEMLKFDDMVATLQMPEDYEELNKFVRKIIKREKNRAHHIKKINEAYTPYNPEDGWTKEDIEKHKAIPIEKWKENNWEIDDGDEFRDKVIIYRWDEEPEEKEATFHKFLRSNAVYPPYYKAVDFEMPAGIVGPMADGRKHGNYNIHDRYEDQKTYNLLSEDIDDEDEEPILLILRKMHKEDPDNEIFLDDRLFVDFLNEHGITDEDEIDDCRAFIDDLQFYLGENLESISDVFHMDFKD